MAGVPQPMSRRERRELAGDDASTPTDHQEERYGFEEPEEHFVPRFMFAERTQPEDGGAVSFAPVEETPSAPQFRPEPEPEPEPEPPVQPETIRAPMFERVPEPVPEVEPALEPTATPNPAPDVDHSPATPQYGEFPARNPYFAPVTGESPLVNQPFPPHSEDATYTPQTTQFAASPDTPFPNAGGEEPPMDTAVEVSIPWWRSVVALVAYGVIVMGGVGFGVVQLLGAADRIELAQEVIIEGPELSGITPVELEDPTDFLAGAPQYAHDTALIEVVTYELSEVDLYARTAEVYDLTYSNGSDTFTVRAYQHFRESEAETAWESLSEGSTDIAPVEAFGEVVGQRAVLDTDEGTVVTWRNLTGVFWLTGPDDDVVEFFEFYGW